MMFNKMIPNKPQKYQQGTKIDDHNYHGDDEDSDKSKKQQNQKEKQRNKKSNDNMTVHIQHAYLETNQSDKIYESTFWCYFNSHRDSTRMVHDPSLRKKKKRKSPVTIAAKVSLSRIKKNIQSKYSKWLGIRKFK